MYIAIFLCCFASNLRAQQAAKVQWMSWEQAVEKAKSQPNKILIHIFTEGCTPCKNMDNSTFLSPEVVNLINGNFYPVKLDAKSKKDIIYNGKNLEYKCQNGMCYHELAFDLTGGSLSFPSVVFMDESMNSIGTIPDYKDANEFLCYVEYYGYGYSTKMTFAKYKDWRKRHHPTANK